MKTPSDRLAALVTDCAAAGVTRQALLLRLDRLPPALSRPHHHRLARSALAPLLRAPRAELFELPRDRLVVTWRGNADALLLEVVETLNELLADGASPSPSVQDLVTLYLLPGDGAPLLRALLPDAPAAALPESGPPLDPASLMQLETTLTHAEISRFVRRRQVWRFGPRSCSLAWEKRTLSLQELSDSLAPGLDLSAEPWLFRRLTRTLDRRMLALLGSAGELANARPFALDLNIASILSAEFLRFDQVLPPALRGQVVLAVAPADVLADATAFSFARNFARTRGYRLMLLDGPPGLLAKLSLDTLDVDLLLLPWSDALPLKAGWLLGQCEAKTLVLECGEDPAALAWGRAAGLSLFTGAVADLAADRATLGERVSAA